MQKSIAHPDRIETIRVDNTPVEPPGIEPGSYVTLPGLLRAQFAHDLYSTLRLRQTLFGWWAQLSVKSPYRPR